MKIKRPNSWIPNQKILKLETKIILFAFYIRVKTSLAAAMIGRFQPFHLGHLELVQQILNENEGIIILVGSSQANYTIKNPFTAGERVWMIRDSLVESKIDMSRVFLVNAIDDENNSRWFSNIKSVSPPFKVLYTGNNFVKALLKRETVFIKEPKLFQENRRRASDRSRRAGSAARSQRSVARSGDGLGRRSAPWCVGVPTRPPDGSPPAVVTGRESCPRSRGSECGRPTPRKDCSRSRASIRPQRTTPWRVSRRTRTMVRGCSRNSPPFRYPVMVALMAAIRSSASGSSR